MWFYGAIEQLLSGWVFELIPGERGGLRPRPEMVVETICGGLEAAAARPPGARGSADVGVARDLAAPGPRPARRGEAAQRRWSGDRAAPCGCSDSGSREPLRARCSPGSTPSPATLPVAQPRERSMDALMADLEAIPHRPAPLRRPRCCARGSPTLDAFVARPAPARRRTSATPIRPSSRTMCFAGRRRRAHRGDGRRSRRLPQARADRRPRPVLVAALRLRARDRRPRLLRVGLQRRSPSTCGASALTNLTSQAPTTAGWKEGEDIVAGGRAT